MADEDSSSEKTEEPTQRRIEEARKRGQIAFSREVVTFLMFLSLALLLLWATPYLSQRTAMGFFKFIESPEDILIDQGNFPELMKEIAFKLLLLIAIPAVATILAALAGSWMQSGFMISGEPLIPKLEKISPLKGFKRIFSLKSVIELLKGIVKITVIGFIGWMVVNAELSRMQALPDYDMKDLLSLMMTLSFRIVMWACVVMAIVAVMDYLYQRYEYLKSLRMSKQELKEEFKQSEGDPVIKNRLKQIRMERARRRMMAEVPKADVVITNPTHYAIALKYDQGSMGAPRLIAKGKDIIAAKIREIAEEHHIPIIQNPPLARSLFQEVELDEEIPIAFYHAVAEVISYVYKLKGKGAANKARA